MASRDSGASGRVAIAVSWSPAAFGDAGDAVSAGSATLDGAAAPVGGVSGAFYRSGAAVPWGSSAVRGSGAGESVGSAAPGGAAVEPS